jgi:hypothetical protein
MNNRNFAYYMAYYILEELDRDGTPPEFDDMVQWIKSGIEAFEAGAHDGQTCMVSVAPESPELYVCINPDHELPSYTGSKYTILGDEGCAYDTFRDIVEVQIDADMGIIYQLVPVDIAMIPPERDKIEAAWIET